MASRSIPELEDNVDFLHNAYNKDISAFSTTKEQLDQSEDYALENGLADLDTESDSVADGIPASLMMSRKSSKKCKTQSKYPVSSGLNPVGQPASNQLNKEQEQPLAPSVASQMFPPVNQQMVGHGDAHQAMISNHPYTDPLAAYSNPHWPTPYNPLPMSMGGDPSTSTGAINPTNPISQLPMTGYYQGPYIAGPPFQDYQLPSYDPPTLRMVPETERVVLH
ncbi:hypothetical protein BDN67DRAFT_1017447 [Paxillus ammoniavirescens]|nr:hypothetical protein BDN67DRAFT_1017447 [Paxillus ammoniavirescens]